jgi:hypothetical protein
MASGEMGGGQMPMREHRGVLILVLGILGLVVCVICGIVAWIMGNNDLREMDAGRMDPEGRQMTQIGRILGMVSVGLLCVGIVFAILWLVVIGGMMAASVS